MSNDINEFVNSRLYIAVLDEVPDFIVPTLVAHTILNAHVKFQSHQSYQLWFKYSFKKCVVRVNRKEFGKISSLNEVYLGYEKTTLNGELSCAIPVPVPNEMIPNVLKFAKLWSPNVNP